MTTSKILEQLKEFGSEQTKKVFIRHGAREPFYGVKVQDLKTIQKKTGKNHELALELFDTGNSDAMYLAALVSEPEKMTKEQLQKWAEDAYWYMLSEYSVAWTAAESSYGWELALEWIESEKENIASTGWSALSSFIAIKKDKEIDLVKIEELLDFVSQNIHSSKNRIRYTMNGFVISVGSYILPLHNKAKEIAMQIGKVSVEMGGTSCKVPLATEYIEKAKSHFKVGIKRKISFC
jgi:3-methyladenine DNA glycosylase AlkD